MLRRRRASRLVADSGIPFPIGNSSLKSKLSSEKIIDRCSLVASRNIADHAECAERWGEQGRSIVPGLFPLAVGHMRRPMIFFSAAHLPTPLQGRLKRESFATTRTRLTICPSTLSRILQMEDVIPIICAFYDDPRLYDPQPMRPTTDIHLVTPLTRAQGVWLE